MSPARRGAQPLSEQIATRMRGMIFDQQRFRPGDRLPDERSLAVEMGVSRTSLREAIKTLAAEGVLVIRRGVGTFVSETPGQLRDPFGFAFAQDKKKLLEDWYQVRLIIESEAMELVAKNATDEELRALEDLARRQSELAASGGSDGGRTDTYCQSFMELDRAFHSALAAATHSAVMGRVLPALHEWVYFGAAIGEYPRLSPQMEENARKSHLSIARFLKLRDGKGANLAMRYHMLQALEDVQCR